MSSLIMVDCFVSALSARRSLAAESREVHRPRIGHDRPVVAHLAALLI